MKTVYTHEHRCPQIELMEELSDEDVNFKDVRYILPFNVSQNIDEPLEMFVRRTNPEEVHLDGPILNLIIDSPGGLHFLAA